MTDETTTFSEWCIVELMGHRRLAGLLTEQEIAGKGFLRLDVPGDGPIWAATQFYSPGSVYCITPVAETVARKIAADNKPRPATRWELSPADEHEDY